MKYYTYKITFKDLPKYFYYGRRKDNGKDYYGSPKTWKHLWDQFEPEIQILQWYETEEEVINAERSIIYATWDSKYSLNENCGGYFTEETVRNGGLKGGPKTKELGVGLFSFSDEERKNINRNGGLKQGPITGKKLLDEGKGLFGMSEEEKQKRNSKGGKTSVKALNSQLWECLETGFVTTPGALTFYQRARNIETSKRRRIR